MREIAGWKLVTSSGKNSTARSSPPLIAGELLHPLGRDVAVVVIRGQDVGALAAELVHHVVEQRLQLLRRYHPSRHVAAVADAPFIERVVEEQPLEAVHDGAHYLARGAGDAAVHHRALVLDQCLGDVLGVVLAVGLGIVEHELQRPAQQAAGGVDLVHSHRRRLNLLQAVDVEDAGAVEDVADLDRVLSSDAGASQNMRKAGESQRARCGLEKLSAAQSHGLLPTGWLGGLMPPGGHHNCRNRTPVQQTPRRSERLRQGRGFPPPWRR